MIEQLPFLESGCFPERVSFSMSSLVMLLIPEYDFWADEIDGLEAAIIMLSRSSAGLVSPKLAI